jgi:putative membrane protein
LENGNTKGNRTQCGMLGFRKGDMTVTSWLPYCGAAPMPQELLSRWNGDPVLLAALALAAALGLSTGRSRLKVTAVLLCSVLLFVSPFCALTSALFAARTVHHVLLLQTLAPLLSFWASAKLANKGLVAWTIVQTLVLWFWHAPPAYAAALSDDRVYWAMQASLLGSATGFWAAVRGAPALAAAGALLITMMQMGLLGALLTFSPGAVYAPHWQSTGAWGLTPLEDQQLAGLIMWVPAAGIYLIAALLRINHLLAPPRPVETSA